VNKTATGNEAVGISRASVYMQAIMSAINCTCKYVLKFFMQEQINHVKFMVKIDRSDAKYLNRLSAKCLYCTQYYCHVYSKVEKLWKYE
jgi:hypothetical protein